MIYRTDDVYISPPGDPLLQTIEGVRGVYALRQRADAEQTRR